jgi:hypothetical protein
MKQLEILRRNLGDTKETRVGLTTEENEENAINDIIECMEADGYEQGDATPAEMEQWDNEFRDWVVMNDVEFEEDRVLIFVRK